MLGARVGHRAPVDLGPLVGWLVAAGLRTAVLGHSLRVHALASAAAEAEGLVVDPLALAIACLFHDSGTIPSDAPDRFEVAGANLARTYARDLALPAVMCQEVWDAVALHTSPGIAERQRPLSGLVRRGVLADFGDPPLRARHAGLIAEIETSWPRANIEVVLQDLVDVAARENPRRATPPSWAADLIRGSAGLRPGEVNPNF